MIFLRILPRWPTSRTLGYMGQAEKQNDHWLKVVEEGLSVASSAISSTGR